MKLQGYWKVTRMGTGRIPDMIHDSQNALMVIHECLGRGPRIDPLENLIFEALQILLAAVHSQLLCPHIFLNANWIRLEEPLMCHHAIRATSQPRLKLRCVRAVASCTLTNFPKKTFEVYILHKSSTREIERFLPHFCCPAHVYPNAGE